MPVSFHLQTILALAFATATSSAMESSRTLVRFNDLAWRAVQNRSETELGGISDLLVQMPSGRLVFVAIDPSEPFRRPKAIPPGALHMPSDKDAPLTLDISFDRWLEAPWLDWNAALVIKNTDEGGRIYGYYQQPWRKPEPVRPWGMTVVAQPARSQPAERYVSLKDLLLTRVETRDGQQTGYLRDFLIDWSQQRVTHALISSRPTPSATPDTTRFAVPITLLNPPMESDAIIINSPVDAFRRAANWTGGANTAATGAPVIRRYPSAAKTLP